MRIMGSRALLLSPQGARLFLLRNALGGQSRAPASPFVRRARNRGRVDGGDEGLLLCRAGQPYGAGRCVRQRAGRFRRGAG